MEPPGLFRGRGDHPKMGKLKARIYPRDITINIGAFCDAKCTSAQLTGQAACICQAAMHSAISASEGVAAPTRVLILPANATKCGLGAL